MDQEVTKVLSWAGLFIEVSLPYNKTRTQEHWVLSTLTYKYTLSSTFIHESIQNKSAEFTDAWNYFGTCRLEVVASLWTTYICKTPQYGKGRERNKMLPLMKSLVQSKSKPTFKFSEYTVGLPEKKKPVVYFHSICHPVSSRHQVEGKASSTTIMQTDRSVVTLWSSVLQPTIYFLHFQCSPLDLLKKITASTPNWRLAPQLYQQG